MSKSLYLVDISSYVFRAYYAIRSLQTSKGIPTNATYGVITMLLKLIREKKPDSLVVVFDSPVPTFRKKIYEGYKAQREVPPEDLPVQFDHIREFVETYPIPSLMVPGYEADDLIATVVSDFRKKKKESDLVIVSGDKDLMQLVEKGITLYDSMRERQIGPDQVREKFGVGPDKVVDVMALAGDASDNIPGVHGVGGKTAAKLIDEWRSLENLYRHVGEVKGKVGEALKKDRDMAFLSKKLVTLCDDVPLGADLDFSPLPNPRQESLNDLYRKFEFKNLLKESAGVIVSPSTALRAGSAKQSPESSREIASSSAKSELLAMTAHYDLILTEKELQKWIHRLKKAKDGFSFDTETTGVDPFRDHLVGMSFSDGGEEACYIPVSHSYLGCPDQLPKAKVLASVAPLLVDKRIPKWAQNGKYDMEIFYREGITVSGLAADSMIASYLISPESPHNLDHLARQYLNHENIKYGDVVGKGQTFADVELDRACRYAAEDADVTFRLVEILHEKLRKEDLWNCYEEIEIPLVDVLFRMEAHGVQVDMKYLSGLAHEFSGRLAHLEKEIFAATGTEFNVQSPKQVADILFHKLQLPPQRKTKTGYSTDEEVLTILARLHPMPKLLLDHRLLTKLKSTYIDGLLSLIHPETGRIHTSYNQTIAATGRLTSSDPNLQNIPIRTEEGRRIRKAFTAPKNSKIISADYSQIELRLLAAFSEDPHLIKAFEKGEDIHRMTATRIFGLSEEKITDELRSRAKTVNFGILYGQSPFGLAQMLSIPQSEAKHYIDGFYKQYPAVAAFKEKALEEVRKTGEVRTWRGRRRFVPEITSKNNSLRTNAERTAFNTIFQGSAADLIKVAMIKIDKKLHCSPSPNWGEGPRRGGEGESAHMIMQVHDELIFEVPENHIDYVSKMIKEEMEQAIPCEVPLKVDMGVGDNWSQAH